ncbi:methylaspartate ammonia-lyase, partial [Morganella morganii]|nr:methylaspartate ammonia-lyase [Morganella morganii]
GQQLHIAIRYGLSQTLVDENNGASNRLEAEVVCDEWHLPLVAEPIPLFGPSDDDRYNAVNKMTLKHVQVLPHGHINNVDEKLSRQGEKLRAYVEWLDKR